MIIGCRRRSMLIASAILDWIELTERPHATGIYGSSLVICEDVPFFVLFLFDQPINGISIQRSLTEAQLTRS